MENRVLLHYRILGSTRERKFSMGSTGFFSKSTFPTNKTLMLKQYGLSSRKRRPPLSDHPGLTVLGGRLWEVQHPKRNSERIPKTFRKNLERNFSSWAHETNSTHVFSLAVAVAVAVFLDTAFFSTGNDVF